MGISGISLWQLLIVLLIVVLIFGTKKLRSMGGDLGSAVRSFRSAMSGDDDDDKRRDGDTPDSLPGAGREAAFDSETRREKDTEHDSMPR